MPLSVRKNSDEKQTDPERGLIEAVLDRSGEVLVGHGHRENGRLKHLQAELVLVRAQPAHRVSGILVPMC